MQTRETTPGRDRGEARRRRQAYASTAMAAGLVTIVSIYVPSFLTMFVEQRELLLVFTALLSVLLTGLHEVAKEIALLRDNFIDRFEAFHLDLFQVFKMLAVFACFSYAGQIFLEYFMSGPITVPNFLFCIVTLLGIALALIPMFRQLMFHWKTPEGEGEEGDDDETDA